MQLNDYILLIATNSKLKRYYDTNSTYMAKSEHHQSAFFELKQLKNHLSKNQSNKLVPDIRKAY